MVGGGPAGLAAAARTRDVEVLVLEARGRLGWPPHCTGIVSPWTAETLTATSLQGLEGEGLLEAVYDEAVVVGPRLRVACVFHGKPLAVKLRRPGLEEYLARLAEDKGHRIRLRTPVLAVRPLRGGVEARAAGERIRARRLLLAAGANPVARLPRPPGLRLCWRYTGLEERLLLSRRLPGNVFITIHGTRLSPGFFAWLAPIDGGRRAVAGTAAPSGRGLMARLEAAKRLLRRMGLLDWSRVEERRGGTILRGPPAQRPAAGPVAWTGDMLCASKPYTGGGLYAAAVLAEPLARFLETGDPGPLEESYRRLRAELLAQHLATRIAASAPRLLAALLHAACTRAEHRGCTVDYDRHSSLISCLLPQPLVREEGV